MKVSGWLPRVVLLYLLTVSAGAQISFKPPTFDERFKEAAIVCRCRVLNEMEARVHDGSDAKGDPLNRDVIVSFENFYKGGLAKDSRTLVAEVAAPVSGQSPLRADNTYVLFLSPTPTVNHYKLSNVQGSSVPLLGASSSTLTSMTGVRGLERDLGSLLESSPTEPNKLYFLGLIADLASPGQETIAALDGLADNTSRTVSTMALSILVRYRPEKYMHLFLIRVADLGRSMPPNIDSIGETVASLPTNTSIEDVEHVATSSNSYLRRSAMLNIRRNASANAVPFLISQLSSTDQDVQYLAVITLAELNHKTGDYAPDRPSFGEKPDVYVELWRRWGLSNGIKPSEISVSEQSKQKLAGHTNSAPARR